MRSDLQTFRLITRELWHVAILWDKIDRGPPPQGRWETVIDWNRAAPPASSALF